MSNADKLKHAETIVRNHSMWSIASGAIPIAFADLAAVSAVQLDMIRQLCEVFEVDFSATKGKAMVSAITSAALARAGAASIVKMVPVAGTLIGSVTGGVLAGASSYGLGQAFKTHLSEGGTFLDLDGERLKRMYREQFEKGKEVVKEWQAEASDTKGDEAEAGGKFNWSELVRRARPAGPFSFGKSASPTEADSDETTAAPTTVDTSVADADKVSTLAKDPESRKLADKLAELSTLHGQGLISDADYEATKARLLSQL